MTAHAVLASAFDRAPATSAAAFAELVGEHQDEIYGVALRVLGDRDGALEVANTVLLKAYRAFARYDRSRPLRHWLLAIAANEAVSAARARARERTRRAPAEAAETLEARAPSPDAAAIAHEERARVRRAVAALPELYRVPVVLRYFSDLSVNEIAAVTGRSPSAVGVQLLRGRALLRHALGEAT